MVRRHGDGLGLPTQPKFGVARDRHEVGSAHWFAPLLPLLVRIWSPQPINTRLSVLESPFRHHGPSHERLRRYYDLATPGDEISMQQSTTTGPARAGYVYATASSFVTVSRDVRSLAFVFSSTRSAEFVGKPECVRWILSGRGLGATQYATVRVYTVARFLASPPSDSGIYRRRRVKSVGQRRVPRYVHYGNVADAFAGFFSSPLNDMDLQQPRRLVAAQLGSLPGSNEQRNLSCSFSQHNVLLSS